MLQAVEAIIRGGRIEPVEPISMEENTRFLLIRLQPDVVAPATSIVRRHPGSAKGRLSIVEDDDDHLNDFTDHMA
ncbi:MAG: hypothetical protein Q7S51_09590 [Gallionellaceae bacterium]|nr:hypothetical protein [Gallionellaceae bacterium]